MREDLFRRSGKGCFKAARAVGRLGVVCIKWLVMLCCGINFIRRGTGLGVSFSRPVFIVLPESFM